MDGSVDTARSIAISSPRSPAGSEASGKVYRSVCLHWVSVAGTSEWASERPREFPNGSDDWWCCCEGPVNVISTWLARRRLRPWERYSDKSCRACVASCCAMIAWKCMRVSYYRLIDQVSAGKCETFRVYGPDGPCSAGNQKQICARAGLFRGFGRWWDSAALQLTSC
jgi:hypothetical protein